MNPELYDFFEILATGILKNEYGTLRIFGNLVYRNFKKWIRKYTNFWKFGVWEFLKKIKFGISENIGNVGNDILEVKLGIWKIENVGNDILEVKLHVGCAWEVYGLNGRCERMRGVVVRCIWWPFGDPELPMSCGVALS